MTTTETKMWALSGPKHSNPLRFATRDEALEEWLDGYRSVIRENTMDGPPLVTRSRILRPLPVTVTLWKLGDDGWIPQSIDVKSWFLTRGEGPPPKGFECRHQSGVQVYLRLTAKEQARLLRWVSERDTNPHLLVTEIVRDALNREEVE